VAKAAAFCDRLGPAGLPPASGGLGSHDGRIADASIRDKLRGGRSPARPSANQRHVRIPSSPVRTAAPTTGRVVQEMLARVGLAECRANAFDVETKWRPWSVAEPHAAQLACAGVDPAPPYAKDPRERGCIDVASGAFCFVAQQRDHPSGDRVDVVSVELHGRFA
jgi:hypothetical protein